MTATKKRFRISLLLQILIAIALGIGCGYIFPEWLGRIFATFNAIFSQYLGFIIPLLILGFVAPAIYEVGTKAGKMLVATALIAYIFTVGSGIFSFFIGSTFFPKMISPSHVEGEMAEANDLLPYFTIEMPPLMTVMTALILAFTLGICLAYLKGDTLKSVLGEFRDVISLTIGKCIIPLLPIYIFGIFLNMTHSGQVGSVLSAFSKIILVIFAMHILLLVTQYVIAALFVRRNPLKLLLTMLPAYFTALGTQSSAATIPVTMRQTIKMGVSEDVAGFVVPLCATIHMSGSILKIVACAIALMIMEGIPFDFPLFLGFICMLAISIVAAPGVPGGAIMASLGIMASMLGFTEQQQALMIALYIAMDSFGTACNVTGDGSIALIINKFFGNSKNPIPQEAGFADSE